MMPVWMRQSCERKVPPYPPTIHTKVQCRQLHAHEATTGGFGTELSLYDRDSRVHKAHADATDYASHEHVWYMVSSCLQQSTWILSAQGYLCVMHGIQTNDENDHTDQHRLASTKSFSNERCSDSADEAADFVDSDDQRDHVRSSVCLRINPKRSGKSRRVDETSHEAIVVADEQEAQAGQRRDRGKEGVAFELQLGEHGAGSCCHCPRRVK